MILRKLIKRILVPKPVQIADTHNGSGICPQNKDIEFAAKQSLNYILEIQGLIALWDFQEEKGQNRASKGPGIFKLIEQAGPVEKIEPREGAPFGKFAAWFKEGQWMLVPRENLGALNLHGKNAQVTVVAWLKRHRKKNNARCEAIAGVWDEPRKKRQYCLFINIGVNKNHTEKRLDHKVSGHVSHVGGPTPGFKYCYDVAQSKTSVPYDKWVCVGFTYDGQWIRSYYNGICEEHEGYNPYSFCEGIFDGGSDGSGFKVGVSDELHFAEGYANTFAGVLGGIAVFQRALTPEEMAKIVQKTLYFLPVN